MRVHFLRADQGGSGFYRMSQPARAVQEAYGVEYVDSVDLDVRARRMLDGSIRIDTIDVDADVMVLQRPLTQRHHAVAEKAREMGIAVVVEVDDDFHNVHPDNVAYRDTDPANDAWSNRTWLTRTCELAHLVTVTTPALLKYAVGREGRVIRNYLPATALEVTPRQPPARSVGWTGTTQTHPADLRRANGALALTDLPLHVVGDREGVAPALGVPEERVVLTTYWTPSIETYWCAVRDDIGIGLAPLETSKFNKAKSWLKPLEYATFGIPFVASPLPEYRLFVDTTNAGLIAHSQRTWAEAVDRVASDDTVRARLAANGLAWANANTLESHASEWYDAWKTAKEIAR